MDNNIQLSFFFNSLIFFYKNKILVVDNKMKEPKIIKPLDVRVFGNVMTHKTSKEGFINYYSDVTYKGKSEIKSLEKNVFTLTPLCRET